MKMNHKCTKGGLASFILLAISFLLTLPVEKAGASSPRGMYPSLQNTRYIDIFCDTKVDRSVTGLKFKKLGTRKIPQRLINYVSEALGFKNITSRIEPEIISKKCDECSQLYINIEYKYNAGFLHVKWISTIKSEWAARNLRFNGYVIDEEKDLTISMSEDSSKIIITRIGDALVYFIVQAKP